MSEDDQVTVMRADALVGLATSVGVIEDGETAVGWRWYIGVCFTRVSMGSVSEPPSARYGSSSTSSSTSCPLPTTVAALSGTP